MHDSITFEQLGIPATVVITDVFLPIAVRFAATLGTDDYHYEIVPHPIGGRESADLKGLAVGIVDSVIAHLVSPGTLST